MFRRSLSLSLERCGPVPSDAPLAPDARAVERSKVEQELHFVLPCTSASGASSAVTDINGAQRRRSFYPSRGWGGRDVGRRGARLPATRACRRAVVLRDAEAALFRDLPSHAPTRVASGDSSLRCSL